LLRAFDGYKKEKMRFTLQWQKNKARHGAAPFKAPAHLGLPDGVRLHFFYSPLVFSLTLNHTRSRGV
jgi:hypothetical protein